MGKYFKERDGFLKNPYKPGAGTAPEFLAGRDKILEDATNNLNELCEGGMPVHTIYYGVRGVGKTVLLNKIEEMAANLGYLYAHIECDEEFDFIKSITLNCRRFIKQLSFGEKVKEKIDIAKAVLMSFKTTYSPNDNSFSFELNEDILQRYGNADTGDFTTDLIELFTALGNLAKKTDKQICFFVDEIQSINKEQLIALIATLHRMNQLELPILLVGAGLPTILRVSGDAKSYAERLFDFVKITSLKEPDAIDALIEPAKAYNIMYTSDATKYILDVTGCYPYFIQQYGKILWKLVSENCTIDKSDAEIVYEEYIEKLDDSFFKVRLNRTTKAEKRLLYAMAKCNEFPCTMGEISKVMGKVPNSLSLNRNNLINKGLIYSPAYGEVDFTVPQFDLFLKRVNPELKLNE